MKNNILLRIILIIILLGLAILLINVDCRAQRITATEMSLDPKANNYIMYFNDCLSISSYKVYEPRKVFSYYDKVDVVDKNVYFSLHRTYYKIYLEEDSLLFIVKPKKKLNYLGDHFCLFIKTIRMYRERQNLLTHKNP